MNGESARSKWRSESRSVCKTRVVILSNVGSRNLIIAHTVDCFGGAPNHNFRIQFRNVLGKRNLRFETQGIKAFELQR
jgi:hypothetical protein